MKKFIFAILTTLFLISCNKENKENKEYVKLVYEVKDVSPSELVDRDNLVMLGLIMDGFVGGIVDDTAINTADKLGLNNLVKTEKYTLIIRSVGEDNSPRVMDFCKMLTCEGNKGIWKVGDKVETEDYVCVKKTDRGWRIYEFNNASTSYFRLISKSY